VKRFRKISRSFRRSLRAVSPVIAVLLMIVIAVAAALFAYAWVMGYLDFTTAKVGNAVQLQGLATDNDKLVLYVQNVGQNTVEFTPENSIYVNDRLISILSIDKNPLERGKTAIIMTAYPITEDTASEPLKVKVVTSDGTSCESTRSRGVSYIDTMGPLIESVTVDPNQGPVGTDFEISATVTDISGVQNVEARIQRPDETDVETIVLAGTGTYTGTWESDTFAGGTYFIDVIATDILDNSFESDNAATIGLSTTITLLSDGFENWNTWDATSSSWYLSPDQHHGGSYAAKSTNGQEGYFDCDPVDTSSSEAVTVEFWYRLSGGVDSGDFEVRFYDGSSWDYIVNLGSQGENSWRKYTYITTDSQYFKSNFRVRFNSSPDDGSETIWVDDFTIYKTTTTVLTDGFEGSSSSWDNNWDNTGHNWYRSTTHHSGTYAAGSRNGNEGYFYSDPRDTRNSIAIVVDFWYRLDDTEDNDFRLYFYDGSSYDTISSTLGSGSEDTWRHFTYTTTSSQYIRSNFRIRFYTTLGSGENVWVDDVRIIAIKSSDSFFYDGFETWNDNWDATSSSWLLGADQHYDGSYAAKSTNGQEGNFYCNPLDAGSATAITVDFWFRVDDLEDNDLQLYYYDGSNYDFITNLGTDPEDQWRHYTDYITDPQYFKSNFRIRFSSSPDNSGENAWIDSVQIAIETIPP
jgi:FlaG/FlaF family flagellin (archaellin)